MSKAPLIALHEIDADPKWRKEGINIRQEMANAIGRHESTVSRMISGETSIDQDQSAALSRRLCQLDDSRYAECHVNGPFAVYRRIPASANGTHHDEMNDLAKWAGDYATAMDAGDGKAASEAVHKLHGVLARMHLEADTLT